jgi:hypothetical protein
MKPCIESFLWIRAVNLSPGQEHTYQTGVMAFLNPGESKWRDDVPIPLQCNEMK